MDLWRRKPTLSSGYALGFGQFTAINSWSRAITITYTSREARFGKISFLWSSCLQREPSLFHERYIVLSYHGIIKWPTWLLLWISPRAEREKASKKTGERQNPSWNRNSCMSKERPDWQDEPATGPGEQLRPKNKVSVCTTPASSDSCRSNQPNKEQPGYNRWAPPSMKDRLPSQRNKEQPGYNRWAPPSMKDGLHAESTEQRAARLQQMSTTLRERLTAESAEQRAARLQQMSTTQCERRAAESAEQRAARLQQMSTTQSERRAAESSQPGAHNEKESRRGRSVNRPRSRLKLQILPW